jgi:hypothetical protein
VVSPDRLNSRGEDLVFAAISSQVRGGPNALPVGAADFMDGQLPKVSEVKVTKIFTIHSSLVLKRLCRLTDEKRSRCSRYCAPSSHIRRVGRELAPTVEDREHPDIMRNRNRNC